MQSFQYQCLCIGFSLDIDKSTEGSVSIMKLLTLENLEKAFCMVKNKGYDDKNSQRIVLDIFAIVEKYGKDVEFYIEHLPDQN